VVVLCNAYYEYMEKGSLSGSEEKVTIRVVRVDDAETVAVLSASLGYPASAGEMRSRIEELAYDKDRMVFVAVLQGGMGRCGGGTASAIETCCGPGRTRSKRRYAG
jgi:hypothetical protein